VPAFNTEAEAKQFLADRIIAEALLQDAPLSDAERRLLYFSETFGDPSPVPDQGIDQSAYERKIRRLVRSAKPKAESDGWNEAVRMLREQDHYLLILIDSIGYEKRLLKLAAVCVVSAFALSAFLLWLIRQ